MARSRKVDHVMVLKARFKSGYRLILFGTARLLQDRILLKGLGYRKTILFNDIVEVRWVLDELTVVTRDGDEELLIIKSAALWKYELQSRCGLKDMSQDMSIHALENQDRSAGADQVDEDKAPGYRIFGTYEKGRQLELGDIPGGDGAEGSLRSNGHQDVEDDQPRES